MISGDSYGAIDENYFTINPAVYLGNDGGMDGDGTTAVVNIGMDEGENNPTPDDNVANPTPVMFVPSPSGPANPSMIQPDEPSPTNPPTASKPDMPSLMQSFFCGTSYDDAQENCHLPCPSGSPAECSRNDLEGYICYSSTTCSGRYVAPTTMVPTERPTVSSTGPVVSCLLIISPRALV